ncbi:hypothetical protein ACSL103130_01060 [Actinomyces slackii]|uniref:PQQ enzyme repeat n=1 Tax=Actinomyces slackii TaxID=52774 RepID=A0A3S4WFW1_9ACTO|nr:hypothetical protein [Actinomyces slackii]VEG74066.1 Uncharacterised protein [Actinomyces slackii]
MTIRLGWTSLICVLALVLAGFVGWKTKPRFDDPHSLDDPQPTASAIPADPGTLSTQGHPAIQGRQPVPASTDPATSWGLRVGTEDGPIALAATPYGPIAINPHQDRDTQDGDERTSDASVYALDPSTGEVRWHRDIHPDLDSADRYAESSFDDMDTLVFQTVQTSPDGEHLALRLELQRSQPLSQTIIVLSTRTGDVIRTVETKDSNVLGQALTNDVLLVQTSSTLHPDGGSVHSYSLTDTKAPADSWASTGWLAGATSRGVIQSAMKERYPCNAGVGERCTLSHITLSDPASGKLRETYDRVTAIRPSGAIERLADGETAPPPRDPAWATVRRELINLESGATTDITGHEVEEAVIPSGRAWLLTPLPDAENPAAWISTDGSLSTGPIEVIRHPDDAPEIFRTTVTMTPGG